jgi:SAM-dependent MidA family methyltransferase
MHFSNELIDAFPVHLLQREDRKLREVYVTCRDQSFEEILGRLHSSPGRIFSLYGTPLEEGQRGSESESPGLGRGREPDFRQGFVLIIDYGYEAAELYQPERRDGTLLCYFRHTTSSDPYRRIGYQDMTAHVNFTALMKKGEALGLKKAGYAQQFRFLVSLGLLQDLENLEKQSTSSSTPLS